ncbi:MAG: ABC transporter permease [Crocinitomicaceae bacterium]|nr:ABC transporter permease [Crocinitomicaceae bacterium]
MNLLKISWKNIVNKPLNTFLSVILLAFGVGIISLLLILQKQLTEKFNRNIKDIDLVLGAKGSPLQLILANVYHVDAPTGNIKISDAQAVIKHPTIKKAIPLAYGDNYQKWRIVGTDTSYPEHYGCQLAKGSLFNAPFEVTIGATVAKETGLKPGDQFESIHGFDQAANDPESHQHEQKYTVKGIFAQSDCAIDNLILTPVESVWMIHEHHDEDTHKDKEHSAGDDHRHSEEAHKEDVHSGEFHDQMNHVEKHEEENHAGNGEPNGEREVTAYLLIKRTPMAQMMLPSLIKDPNMQLALPAIEINRLSQNFGLGMDTAKAIAILIMILSFISVFVSLYNSLKERKYELALMRTMGGSRKTLFLLIIQEGLLLVLIGCIVGAVLSRMALFALSNIMKENFHYSINNSSVTAGEWLLFAITLCVGILASLLPAVRAFRMDISKTLSNG